MMTFGTTTLVDLLSWIVALTLGLKLIATLVLLRLDRRVWDQPGFGAILWWSTKLTPIVATGCAMWIAVESGMRTEALVFSVLLLFVLIAVPWKVMQRRARVANRMRTRGTLADP